MVGYEANDTITRKQKLIIGCISGISTKFITQPMDVIKIRAQLTRKRIKTTYNIASNIFWREGITAFWHGHCLGQLNSILGVTSQFFVYELSTQLSSTMVPREYRHIGHFFCGALAGSVSTSLVLPLEVIRVRQMLVKDQYRSIIQGAKTVYRYGGILAFYEGLSASLLQMGPQVGLQFTTFSFIQPLMLNLLGAACTGEECKSKKRQIGNIALASSIAGSMSGFISKTLTYPLDMAKRRLQISSHKTDLRYKTPSQSQDVIRCKRLFECLAKAYKKEGCRGLFRGWTVTVYKAQLTSVAAFTSYELLSFAAREINAMSK